MALALDAESDFDVVVVGMGPVGAIAACWLGQAGLRTLVVDKSEEIWQIPRAMAIDHEILRVLQNLGLSEQVLPFTAPFAASEHFGVEGQLIRRIHMVDPPYPLGYTPTMVFTQPPVERILREHASSYANVTVSLGCLVTHIEQTEQDVTVHLSSSAGTQAVRAKYAIGCDGASSSVRRLMGIKFDDLDFDEPWLVVDVRMHESSLSKLPQTAAQYCDPARPTTFIIGPGNHRRWEIMLSPGEDPRAMEQPENVWRLLSPWITPEDGELWRASSYRFHALLAADWRKGRVFLAGDAAHQQPPFIGQGMCQGIRDVTNLCWKLEAALHGKSDDSILDSYEEERSRHVHTLTSGIKAIGHHICERDPELARLRDEALLEQGGGVPPSVTRQDIVPALEPGSLVVAGQAANGTLFPQPWILTPDGPVRMDEIVGHGWRVIVDGRRVESRHLFEWLGWGHSDDFCKRIAIGGHGLEEQDGVTAQWFQKSKCIAALVRPDHYVYAVFSTLAEADDGLAKLQAQLKRSGHFREGKTNE